MNKEVKDSGIQWIGFIPNEWTVIPSKFLFAIQSGSTPKSEFEEYWDGDVIWVTPADFKTEDMFISRGRRNISKAGQKSCSTSMIDPGSLIFSKRAPIGSVVINLDQLCTNQGCLSCSLKNRQFSIEYFYYLMSIATEQYNLLGSGTTFKEISLAKFSSFALCCPPKSEQLVISNRLKEKSLQIQRLVSNLQKQIENLKQYKQSLITEAVTKGIYPSVPMKDSGVSWTGIVPKDSSISRIGRHYKIVLGKMLCNEGLKSDMERIPYICAANVHFDGVQLNDLKEMWFYQTEIETYKIAQNDLLVVEGGAGAGGAAVVDTDITDPIGIQNSIMMIRPQKGQNIKFLYYLLYYYVHQNYIDYVCNKATIPHFTKEKLSATPFIFHSENMQNDIVCFLDEKCMKIDNLIKLKNSKIDKLNQYKQSLIYEYVTGKKEA